MASSADTTQAETKKEDAEIEKTQSNKEAAPPSPREELRSNLVDLAVKFLSNPRVTGSPMDQKRAFLKKKGEHSYCHPKTYIAS